MPGLFEYLMRKATGKRTGDIELPNESGEVDSRLPARPDVRGAFGKAADTLKDLNEAEGGNALERLQAAGRRAMDRETAAKRKKYDEENRRAVGR